MDAPRGEKERLDDKIIFDFDEKHSNEII